MNLLPHTSNDELMTFDEFKFNVELGLLIDYDGYGYWATDKGYNPHIRVSPSQIATKPDWATHVVWCNR